MPLRKTAIAVPAEVLDEVDEVAHERGESRSAFITRILRAALRARRDHEITRKLAEVFGDPAVQEQSLRTARDLEELGTDWADESW